MLSCFLIEIARKYQMSSWFKINSWSYSTGQAVNPSSRARYSRASLDCWQVIRVQEIHNVTRLLLQGSPGTRGFSFKCPGLSAACWSSPPVGLSLQLTLHQRFNEIWDVSRRTRSVCSAAAFIIVPIIPMMKHTNEIWDTSRRTRCRIEHFIESLIPNQHSFQKQATVKLWKCVDDRPTQIERWRPTHSDNFIPIPTQHAKSLIVLLLTGPHHHKVKLAKK